MPLPITAIDYAALGINILILIFSKPILKSIHSYADENDFKSGLRLLRIINISLIAFFGFNFFLGFSQGKEISQTGLALLSSHLVFHFFKGWVLRNYGLKRDIEVIDDKVRVVPTYGSETITLTGLAVILIITGVVILNIWKLNDLLQTTSVIGALVVILFSTKDYWLGEAISGLIILYDEQIQRGSIIKLKEQDITGIVLEISLTRTLLRDLAKKHEITLPNSMLRNEVVEVLTRHPSSGFKDYIDFNIGYTHSKEEVESFFQEVWLRASENSSFLKTEKKPSLSLIETGDHALKWRYFFYIDNVFRLLDARNIINTTAFEVSREKNLSLNTPLTHQQLN